jgi:hypothetical protein
LELICVKCAGRAAARFSTVARFELSGRDPSAVEHSGASTTGQCTTTYPAIQKTFPSIVIQSFSDDSGNQQVNQ